MDAGSQQNANLLHLRRVQLEGAQMDDAKGRGFFPEMYPRRVAIPPLLAYLTQEDSVTTARQSRYWPRLAARRVDDQSLLDLAATGLQ